jgi:DNA helicase-2/ATP-dependent DNA helicase PcrA|tara:strand:- start:22093 stop:24087 length:1995 start_codon:yes stop_codon:yes gene_type:complete
MYTEEQKKIIDHETGHASVKAVPGSGKTHAMVGRVVRLISSGVPAKRIAVVMFNSQAATDFYRRLEKALRAEKILIKKDRMPVVRTLHSLAARMIHTLIQNEYLPDYTFDPEKSFIQRNFIREVLTEFSIDSTNDETEKLQSAISWIKSRCDDTVNYFGDEDCREVHMFNAYEQIRCKAKVRFFDDLLYDTAMAVKKNPSLVDILGNKVRHIIIDEFQDVNPCQMQLVSAIAGSKASIMIVGDINQSIYGFRGAEPKIMLEDFPKNFEPVADYQLSKTFRFGSSLSDIANAAIVHNKERFELDCVSDESVEETSVNFMSDDNFDAVKTINSHEKEGDYSSIAILVREFAHKVKIEMDILKANIPYRVLGGDSLLNHRAVLSFLGYLRLADGAENLNELGDSERKYIVRCMLDIPNMNIQRQLKVQLINRLTESPENENIFLDISDKLSELPNLKDDDLMKQERNLSRREDIWGNALFYDVNASAYLILKDLYKNQLKYDNYFNFTSTKSQDAEYKKCLLEGLIAWAKDLHDSGKATSIKDFLKHVDQCKFDYQENVKEGRTHCLTITSMHASKGLEWDTVILPELLVSNLPVLDAKNNAEDIEGDRRLFYVAMTRAKKAVYFIGGKDIDSLKDLEDGVDLPLSLKQSSSLFIYECFSCVSRCGK